MVLADHTYRIGEVAVRSGLTPDTPRFYEPWARSPNRPRTRGGFRLSDVTLPLGVVGLGGSFAVYVRNRRGCAAAGCRVVGQGLNQAVLALATVVVTVALLLRVFPSWTAWLLQHL